jgi:hypothetical protein
MDSLILYFSQNNIGIKIEMFSLLNLDIHLG